MKTFLLTITALISTSLFADIIYVPADTSTIQGGIYLASEGDTVLVAEDIYYENINFKGKAITVASRFIMDGDTSHISNTIIDGSQPSHPDSGAVVSFVSGEDTTSIICGFTITGGRGNKVYIPSFQILEFEGGGIHLYESSAQIKNNKIINNNINSSLARGPVGGGIAALNFRSIPTFVIIKNCQITSNTLTGKFPAGGGIIAAHLNVNYIIENNIVSNNRIYCTKYWKAMGGGINVDHALPTSGTMIIRNNFIRGNEVHGERCFGGGFYIILWEIEEMTYDRKPNPIIYNNIIEDNYSEWKGGGMSIWIGTYQNTAPSGNLDICPQPALINNTLVNNKAAKGSGIFCYYSNFLIMNSILWNDLSLPGSSEIDMGETGASDWDNYPNESEIHIYHSDIQGSWESGRNLDTYPAFEDTSEGNYSLSDSSVCIGWGIDSVKVEDTWYHYPPNDYYGNERPHIIDKFVDVGAIESIYQRDPVAIESTTHSYLNKFGLSQNYPNPFNPSTTIEFTLPKSEFTTLKVYNIIGKEVATLVHGKLQAGNYTYQFDGGNLASGIYLYRIEAGTYSQVRKMVLIK